MIDEQDQQPSNLPERAQEKDSQVEKPSGPIDAEVLERLPPEVRRVVESFSFSAPVFNPILKKVTEEHITKVLDQTEKDSERSFKDAQSTKKYNLVYVLVAALLFVFATVYLAGQDKELYRDILTKLIIFFGGAGAGYGIKAFRDRD